MERRTADFRTKFTVTGAQAVIQAAVLADVATFRSPDERTVRIMKALVKADLVIVPKPSGNAEAVREAVRTGNWDAVSERDLIAWREAPLAPEGANAEVVQAAIHGVDGMEDPQLSDLSWLRDLLRSTQNPGAFRALQGDSDDPGAVTVMLQSVEDLYRRLAALSFQRPDIYDSENPRNRPSDITGEDA
ncbi:hypothetical protein [Methylobacterium sp. WCS2018Hpa-22]|uniref:hypothetical protein n=1 Tax=Methylobacterium sp. WCS2018Hpa-22 TaxID=3073633 RepID=UPI002889F710|nr:hypothetical protein [Methylobacterium sp. WCS2018Hpa-22]